MTLKSSVLLSTVVEYLRGSRWVLQPDTTFSDIKKGQVLALKHPLSFLVVIMNAKYLFSERLMISPKCLQSIRFTKKQSTQAQTICISYLYHSSVRYSHIIFNLIKHQWHDLPVVEKVPKVGHLPLFERVPVASVVSANLVSQVLLAFCVNQLDQASDLSSLLSFRWCRHPEGTPRSNRGWTPVPFALKSFNLKKK